jgi:hypothetical protein
MVLLHGSVVLVLAAISGGFLWLKYKRKGTTNRDHDIEIYESQEEVEITYDNGNRNAMEETVQYEGTENLRKTMTMV